MKIHGHDRVCRVASNQRLKGVTNSTGQCYGHVSSSPSCCNPKWLYRGMMPKHLHVVLDEISSIHKLG